MPRMTMAVFSLLLGLNCPAGAGEEVAMNVSGDAVALPSPRLHGDVSLEETLAGRRTVREFSGQAIGLGDLAQLLWAAQGVSGEGGLRTAPSAGALYPLEIYAAVGAVKGLEAGIYRYLPARHVLERLDAGDKRRQVAAAALEQSWLSDGAVILAFAALMSRTTGKYGRRGIRYVHIEVGHAAQNVLLQAQALGLAAAVVGAFEDDRVGEVLGIGGRRNVLYLVPVGRP